MIKETQSNSIIGTKISKIVEVAKNHGYKATSKEDCTTKDIELEIKNGNSIILLQNGVSSSKKGVDYSGIKDGHYIAIKSIDGKKITFEDPANKGFKSMNYFELEER
jgi:hypothetical protein